MSYSYIPQVNITLLVLIIILIMKIQTIIVHTDSLSYYCINMRSRLLATTVSTGMRNDVSTIV